MRRAIELGEKGIGKVSPNPLVGAVIVKDGRIIGEGYHEYYGGLHAERNAIKNCSECPSGADIYVTLEPCCHHGKTPPCTEAIIESGIKRVVVGCLDPNPLVAGQGISRLKISGIEVTVGICEEECKELAEIFMHYIKNKVPYVTMKYAMTADGKIATTTGDSKWVTGEAARAHVHLERKRNKGIMVGIGTVLADDPMLNCRMSDPVHPVRIICDSSLRVPLDSQVVKTAYSIPTIVATSKREGDKHKRLEDKGVEVVQVPEVNGRISLEELMKECGKRKIDSILLEGGGTLNAGALESGIISKVQVYIAPKLVGGIDAKTAVAGQGISYMRDCFKLTQKKIQHLGDDILIEYQVTEKEG